MLGHQPPESHSRVSGNFSHFSGSILIVPERVNDMSTSEYRMFLQSYEGKKAELELLKEQLAG